MSTNLKKKAENNALFSCISIILPLARPALNPNDINKGFSFEEIKITPN